MAQVKLPKKFAEEKALPSPVMEIDSVQVETGKAVLATLKPIVAETSQCLRCGRQITNPLSLRIGYGPECASYLMINIPESNDSEPCVDDVRRQIEGQRYTERWIPKVFVEGVLPEPERRTKDGFRDAEIDTVTTSLGDRIRAKVHPRYEELVEGLGMTHAGRNHWVGPLDANFAADLLEKFSGRSIGVSDKVQQLADNVALDSMEDPDDTPIPFVLTEPWEHQRKAFWFAKERTGAMLALGMGLGKSKVTIDLLNNVGAGKVLILAPKFVVKGWAEQFELHSPVIWNGLALDRGSVASKAEQVHQLLSERDPRIPIAVIINYESAWRQPLSEVLLSEDWDCIVADESHRIKSYSSKQSQFVGRLGKHADRRLCLSGTPMAQTPLDLFGQYRFLDPSCFGENWWKFREKYAIMGGWENRQVVGVKNRKELNRKFYSLAYKVNDDVLDLPEPVHIDRFFEPGRKLKKIFTQLEDDMFSAIEDGTLSPANAAVRVLRLQQLSSGYAKLDPEDKPLFDTEDEGRIVEVDDGKKKLLEEVLEDLAPEEPVVVVCRFRHDLDTVHTIAESMGRSSGELSGRGRDDREAWKRNKFSVLAVQIQAGAEGINDLVHSRYAILYSIGHSLKDYEQFLKRLHRPGQTRNPVFIHLQMEDFGEHTSIDRRVYGALRRRKNVIESIMGRAT